MYVKKKREAHLMPNRIKYMRFLKVIFFGTNYYAAYCISLYVCELWIYNNGYINEIFIAWRKMLRKLLKLSNRSYNYIVYGIVSLLDDN